MNMDSSELAETLDAHFTTDNGDTLAETLDGLRRATRMIALAVSPDAAPGIDATGGTVASLAEAVMGITAGLCRVAEGLRAIAEAIEAQRQEQK